MANNYAVTLLESAGDPTGALELLEEVLTVRRRMLGNEHPETLDSITNLALNYMEVGRYEAALPLSEEAVALTRGTLAGPDRVEGTAHAIGSLAAVLHLMGEPRRARQLHEETLQMRRRLLGRGLLGPVHQLDVGHGRVVADTKAVLQNAQIAAVAFGITRAQQFEQLDHVLAVAQTIDCQTAIGQGRLLAQGDDRLDHAAQFLGFRYGSFNSFVRDERIHHVAQHG